MALGQEDKRTRGQEDKRTRGLLYIKYDTGSLLYDRILRGGHNNR